MNRVIILLIFATLSLAAMHPTNNAWEGMAHLPKPEYTARVNGIISVTFIVEDDEQPHKTGNALVKKILAACGTKYDPTSLTVKEDIPPLPQEISRDQQQSVDTPIANTRVLSKSTAVSPLLNPATLELPQQPLTKKAKIAQEALEDKPAED